MSRYEIKPVLPPESPLRRFYVRSGTAEPGKYRHVSAFVPEAEASIIAWALNAVADGRPLHAPDPLGTRSTLIYDGRTDGVAP